MINGLITAAFTVLPDTLSCLYTTVKSSLPVPALIHMSINSGREAVFPAKPNKQYLFGQGYSIPKKPVPRGIVLT